MGRQTKLHVLLPLNAMPTEQTSKTLPAKQNSGHTPGPWESYTNYMCPGKLKGCYVDAPNSGRVAEAMSQGCLSQEVCEANARLIAAAPELLEALETAVRVRDMRLDVFYKLHGLPGPGDAEKEPEWVVQARAAIAKAKGQP